MTHSRRDAISPATRLPGLGYCRLWTEAKALECTATSGDLQISFVNARLWRFLASVSRLSFARVLLQYSTGLGK